MSWKESFQILTMDPRDYILKRAVPIGAAAVAVAVAAIFVAGSLLPAWAAFAVPGGILLIVGAGIFLYPASMVDRKRMEIDNALPFFMTHFGVLSTSNMPRTEVFRILSERREYKALALELKRIHGLVVDWKMALPEACRFASASTPSQIFGDFLERLAHAMETGQPLDKFLKGEQDVVMKEYATVYETSIYQVETWKDIYMSSMMSGAFLAIFALITPILTGASPQGLLIGTLGFILFMEVLLAFVLKMRTPADRLWHGVKIMTGERRRLRQHLIMGGAASLVIMPTL
ncbi:MAG: type II secretion system F family protein, partial [Thermoplasmatota archaeon]